MEETTGGYPMKQRIVDLAIEWKEAYALLSEDEPITADAGQRGAMMNTCPSDHPNDHPAVLKPTRRVTERVPSRFTVMYSGMQAGYMLMGDGLTANLSDRGVGICGDRGVTRGMELALFITIPGMEDPICLPQCRVSWVSGLRFGVEMLFLSPEILHQLHFHTWNSSFRPSIGR